MPQPEQPHTILLVHCHYRLPGGEDAVFAAECAMLQAHGHRVITYERNNDAGGLAQKLLLPLRAIYSTKTVREVRALIRKEQVDLVHVHNTLLTISPSVFQACFKEHVPAVQTLHNFRIFCRSMALAVRCGTAATAAAVPKVWSVRAFMRSIACLAPTAR